ncbi:MAG TPA: ATP-binding protein [Candidatus Saccharimonadales bacterium]|nr:ATP-binding protein [Candidatus Saccharimonadales bacterium]
MDHLQKFVAQLQNRVAILLMLNSTMIIVGYWLVAHYVGPNLGFTNQAVSTAIILVFTAFLSIILLSWVASRYLTKPMRLVWQAVLHISPETANYPAPDTKRIGFGHEFVTALVGHIYQLATVVDSVEQLAKTTRHDLKADFVANSIPLPLLVLDNKTNVVFANEPFLKYVNRDAADTVGQNLYLVLDLLFSNQNTLDAWLERARASKVTATKVWERVRLDLADEKTPRYFDLVAYYNKDNPNGFEIMLVLFDRTRQYSQDNQALSFVALAVHELRTPLTLLRGYIDVFEEELDDKLDDEMKGFMRKMKAAAQQLAAFTSNILNVARFENDQLVLKLHEEKLEPLLKAAINNMELRAKVRGIKLTLTIDPGLPTVGADAVSISEVVNNLIDNAIKYSADSQDREVIIHSYVTKDGLVETTVQDFGVGIPETAVGNLFSKFYRDYRNRNNVGGTGMGLYLSKAIVTAHGGNIWVRSKEGQGTTFGFTLQPYTELADELKKGDNADVTRTAHGWIKNHSLYRR